jgi:hypothetical protein
MCFSACTQSCWLEFSFKMLCFSDSKFTQQELPACKPILTPQAVNMFFLCIVFVNCDYLFNRYMHLEVTIYMVYIAFLAGYFSILDCHRHIYPYWSCFAYCFTRCTLECNTVFLFLFTALNFMCIILCADFELVITIYVSGCWNCW